mmetsp:Transcript_500/g.471  ORF Transcript_500/g.471 Transcript_500/m.471 type:complete len:221 (+) Transcript_500:271-933(+)
MLDIHLYHFIPNISNHGNLRGCAADGINLVSNTEVQKLISNLHLQSSQNRWVNFGTQNNLLILSNLYLHGSLYSSLLGLCQRISRNDCSLNLSTLCLHELAVSVRNLRGIGQTGVSSKNHHKIQGYNADLSLEHLLNSLLLLITADKRILQKRLESWGVGSGKFNSSKLVLNGLEHVSLGSSSEGGIGIPSLQSIKTNGGSVGSISAHGASKYTPGGVTK